ncbi:MAG: hypothetical protein IJI07_08960 [Flexilinea sp.]|nr:hypothetical protein [Flexilinea sp.]
MSKKLIFVGMVLILMASFTAVLADQNGSDCWCNADQYGCWVTDEDGGKCYIMFWNEASREYFMGSGSKATVCDPLPGRRMTLEPVPAERKNVVNLYITDWAPDLGPSEEGEVSVHFDDM